MLDALVTEARLRFGLDPAAGVQVVASEALVATPIEASRPVILVPLAVLVPGVGAASAAAVGAVAPLPGRHGPRGRTALDVLARAYPADHPVGRFGTDAAITTAELTEADLAQPLYLAPLAPEAAVAGPWAMPAISDRLRAPGGCPWDQEQTHQSLRKHLLEEAYEVYDALEAGATPELAGELGDLLLQVVLHAQLAAEAGVFDLADVQAAIATKIVRRHPHVFGEAEARTASDVNRQWERIKATERADAAGSADESDDAAASAVAVKGALDGIGLAAGAGGQPGDAGARRQPRLRLAVDRRRPRQGDRGDRRAARGGRGRRPGRLVGGVRRPAVRARQRRAQARHRGRGRRPRGERQVPATIRQRRAPGRGARRGPARPRLRGARCALGYGQGRGEHAT